MKIPHVASFVAFLGVNVLLSVGSAVAVGATTKPAQLTVIRPDGKPAAAALVVMLPLLHPDHAYIFQGDFNPKPERGIEQYRLDAQGSLVIRDLRAYQWIAVFDPSGYLEADRAAVGQTTLMLLPWGRVEGKLIRQGAAAAGQTMRGVCYHSKERGHIMFLRDAKTDAGGNFVLDRLPPGKGYVDRETPQSGGVQYTTIELSPGKTTTVTIGGVGRLVTGKVKIPAVLIGGRKWRAAGSIFSVQKYPPLPKPEEILDSTDEKRRDAWMQAFLKTNTGKAYQAEQEKIRSNLRGYTIEFKSDGSYRIEDVLPGDYDLTATLYLLSRAPGPDVQDEQIAKCHVTITIPAAKNDDHNPVPVQLIEMLEARIGRVGDPMQSFTAPTLDGQKLSLADLKGHYVLLDFWATTCGPCVAEMPNLKNVYDTYGKDGRLQMVSLTLDEKPEVAKRFVDKNQMTWKQVWLGNDAGKQILDTIEPEDGIPYILLIGPDGRVAAAGLRGPEIGETVAKLLNRK